MLISTKGRYALRFLLDLAMHSEGKPVRVKDVSIRQEISDKYLEQVVATLTKAGFVRSIRGPRAGICCPMILPGIPWGRSCG